MDINESLICPKCKGVYFEIKREATYLYTYKLETPLTKNWSDEDETLPFLFDNRELLSSNEYIECRNCGAIYPYDLYSNNKIHFTIVQKAIRSDIIKEPEFLG
ncbi:hypothetical protein RBU61_07165 [Tissierella sp. MB52-C2]|uniref:hypothetical protein n=1 Tax=Tissierella sp. MB52-C2 TaxID=3070999 RepID=UPI00280A9ACB|nr:hypothetical protein [Tissierella sp. MB52-C2]WMM26442.1 hypothetical protein RBU61_07165 [Tissierella sp. MB52-C2]